jgi:hypothetical protein
LDNTVIFSTLKKSVPAWHQTYIRSNARANIGTIDQLMEYYEALEEQESRNRDRQGQNRNNSSRRNNGNNYRSNNRNNSSGSQNRDSNTQTR